RTERTAEDEQHGSGRVQAESGSRLSARSSTIEVDDFATQRHPDDLTVCERCAFESDSDTRGAPRSQFVRETWPGVRLVHDVGNLLTARGDVCGRRRVP